MRVVYRFLAHPLDTTLHFLNEHLYTVARFALGVVVLLALALYCAL